MRLMGIDINTIVIDNVATRCDGCLEIIDGTPWRLNILDIVSTEVPMSAARQGVINPGPFQFHGDAGHVRRWMADNGYWFCRKSEVREIMRPIPVPAPDGTLAALLGASPGASTAVSIMLTVLQRCFPAAMQSEEWQRILKQMIPSYGQSLANDRRLLERVRSNTSEVLGLTAQS